MGKRREAKVEAAVEKIEAYLSEHEPTDFKELYTEALGVKKLGARGSYIGYLALQKGVAEERIRAITEHGQGVMYAAIPTIEDAPAVEVGAIPSNQADLQAS